MAEARRELREMFETLFIAPFEPGHWASARGRSHWVELEGWLDSMAGPLSSITSDGACEYVYPRKDWYFVGVNEPPGLRTRLLEWHAGLASGVERFTPATPDEATDLAFMRSVVGRMRELVEQACVVEQARWEATRQAEPDPVIDQGDVR
jgi:hypothetical protein